MSQVYVNSFASIPFAPRGWMLAWAPIHLSFQKLLHTCSLCVNAPAAWKQFADNCHSTTTQETQASRSSSCPPGQGLRQALAHHSQALVAGRRNSMHWSPLEKFKGIHWKNFPSKTQGNLWFQAAPWNRYFDQTMVVQKFGTWRQSYRSVSKFNSRPAKLVIKRNEHLHIKHCKNEVVFRRIWKGPKNGRKQKTWQNTGKVKTVGKTGGVLSAAFHVVTTVHTNPEILRLIRTASHSSLICRFFLVRCG